MTVFRYFTSPFAGIASVYLLQEIVVGLLAGPLPLGETSFAGLAPFYVVAIIGGAVITFRRLAFK